MSVPLYQRVNNCEPINITA